MDASSDFFKSGFLSVHQNKLGKNYQQKTLRDRLNNFNNTRRETRNTLMLHKRNIDENMTPLNTPEKDIKTLKIVKQKKEKTPNKRLEMLKKWKAEKEKRKQEERQKLISKPLFKVCHVPVDVGLPNLRNINKEIKRKPIKSIPTSLKSQFAPPNHKFHAPKNIMAIDMKNNACSTVTTESVKVKKKPSFPSHRNTRAATRALNADQNKIIGIRDTSPTKKSQIKLQINKGCKQAIASTHNIEHVNPRHDREMKQKLKDVETLENSGKSFYPNSNARCELMFGEPGNAKDMLPNVEISRSKSKNKSTKLIKENPIQMLKKYRKSGIKSVGFNVIEIVDSDDDSALFTEIDHITPKKGRKYQKTPKRVRKPERSPHEQLDTFEPEKQVKTPGSLKKMRKSRIPLDQNRLDVNGDAEEPVMNVYKKTPKKGLRSQRFSNIEHQESLKNAAMEDKIIIGTPRDKQKSAAVLVKNILTADYSKAQSNTNANQKVTPKNVTREYNKTPRRQESEIISDAKLEDAPQNADEKEYHTPINPKNNRKSDIAVIESIQKLYVDEGVETELDVVKSRNSTIGSATGSASPDYPIKNITNMNSNTSFHTPAKTTSQGDTQAYISPFVTISRGKSSARKEYHVRQSTGGSAPSTPEFNRDISNNTSPKAGADYFTRKLNYEITRIQNMYHEWNKYRENNDVPEEANDMIDVAIGQSKLLISKKFQQFQNLIEKCRRTQYNDKPITCTDLHGFWDMVYMQVEDLNKRFNNLEVLKGNNWQEVIPEKKPITKRGRGRPKKPAAPSALRDVIRAARDRKKLNSGEKSDTLLAATDEVKVFSGGYYSIKSPIREQLAVPSHPGSARRSMRVSLLANQAKKRISSCSGLTVLEISRAIKSGDGLTPGKSILKSDVKKSAKESAKKVTKSVLFKDNLEEDIEQNFKSPRVVLFKDTDDNADNKENDLNKVNNIIIGSATPTRKSKRLNKIN